MAKSLNTTLSKANKAKNDEFYTQLTDVEKELRHYTDQFRGKVVLCNCDDPYESAFFKYFAANFNQFGLKKLIATCYAGSPVSGTKLPLSVLSGKSYRVDITEVPDANGDGSVNLLDVEWLLKNKPIYAPLEGDGDFRSPECAALLDEADIVVTNPPFSLFREFIAMLVEHGKQFLVLGSLNAITYKNIFRLIMEDRLWLGYSNGGKKWFRVPDSYDHTTTEAAIKVEGGVRYLSLNNITWYTNLDTSKRHEFITLYKQYSPREYPTYTNYPAIEVSRVADIPMDYDDAMGVPITFLDKYNPEQFEILGESRQLTGSKRFFILKDGKPQEMYARIAIRRIGEAS
jgi:Adenine-specific methyltransferase EcoRI